MSNKTENGLRLFPSLKYIGQIISRENFLIKTSNTEFKNSRIRSSLKEIIILHSIRYIERNQKNELEILQVNTSREDITENDFNELVKAIQRCIVHQTLLIFNYNDIYYKIAVPLSHIGKKQITVVDRVFSKGWYNGKHEIEEICRSIDDVLPKQKWEIVRHLDFAIIKAIVSYQIDGVECFLRYEPEIADHTVEALSISWIKYLQDKNLEYEDPPYKEAIISKEDIENIVAQKRKAVEEHYGFSIEQLLRQSSPKEIDEIEAYGNEEIKSFEKEILIASWAKTVKYQEIYEMIRDMAYECGLLFADDFFDSAVKLYYSQGLELDYDEIERMQTELLNDFRGGEYLNEEEEDTEESFYDDGEDEW